MGTIFEDFAFIKDMDKDLGEFCGTFLMELNNRIYEKLVNHYPGYRDLIRRNSELADELFADRLSENAKFGEVKAELEGPINTANFLLGVKLGMQLGHSPHEQTEKK